MGNRKCSEIFGAFFVYKYEIVFGERVWESNPPRTLLTPNTGFEDQGAHQLPNRAHESVNSITKDVL